MEQELPEYHRKVDQGAQEHRRFIAAREDEQEEDETLELPHQSNPNLAIITDHDAINTKRRRRYCIWGTVAGTLILLVLVLLLIFMPGDGHHKNPHDIHISEFSLGLDVIAPKYDTKQYRVLRLSNQLTAVVIQDSKTKNSAASISVGAGSGSEDSRLPGQAHYLEHAVFLGSKKYPHEDALFDYVMTLGGTGNAYTAQLETNYFFQVGNPGFEKSFDILTDMVAAPLLEPEPLSRQYNAVNSEYEKDLIIDEWKFWQLLCHLANQGNPMHRFSIGNTETLHTIPEKEGLNVPNLVRNFYERYYSANLITAAVYGHEELGDLMDIADSTLSEIQNNHRQAPDLSNPEVAAFDPTNLVRFQQQQGQVIVYTPIAKKTILHFFFSLPASRYLYKQNPELLVLDLINRTHKNSASDLLLSKGWIRSFKGEIIDKFPDQTPLQVKMELTDSGRQKIKEVSALVYEYLSKVGESILKPEVQQFIKNRQLLAFDYSVFYGNPFNTVSSLASALHYADPKYIMTIDRVCYEFDNQILQKIKQALTPENSLVIIALPEPLMGMHETEPWFNTTYSARKMSPDDLTTFNSKSNPELEITIDETYNPVNTEVLCKDKQVSVCSEALYTAAPSNLVPVLAYWDQMMEVWWKFDSSLNLPKANVRLLIEGLFDPSVVKNVVKLQILVQAMKLKVAKQFANALDYGYSIQIKKVFNGIEVTVEGFSDTLPALIEKLSIFLQEITFEQNEFETADEIVMKGYANFIYDQPYNIIRDDLYCLLNRYCFSKEEKTEYGFFSITVGDINRFSRIFFSKVYVKALVVGNILKETAQGMTIQGIMAMSKLPLTSRVMQQTVEVQTSTIWKDALENPKQNNDATLIYYEIGEHSPYQGVLLTIYSMIARNPFFNILRTQKQLGYVVSSRVTEYNSVLGFYILVQGSKQDPVKVGDYIIEAVDAVHQMITQMTEEELKSLKQIVRDGLDSNPESLGASASNMWDRIVDNSYIFRDKQIYSEKIEEINLDAIKGFSEYLRVHSYIRIELTHGANEADLSKEKSRNNIPVYTSEYQRLKNGRFFPAVNNFNEQHNLM